MIAAVLSLFAVGNVNIFYILFVTSILTGFFRICLEEKRFEDLKKFTQDFEGQEDE
tara:strand:+ start:188 stop:355 length:168 start_codon:yes stop_codon:yes gene_type:complete